MHSVNNHHVKDGGRGRGVQCHDFYRNTLRWRSQGFHQIPTIFYCCFSFWRRQSCSHPMIHCTSRHLVFSSSISTSTREENVGCWLIHLFPLAPSLSLLSCGRLLRNSKFGNLITYCSSRPWFCSSNKAAAINSRKNNKRKQKIHRFPITIGTSSNRNNNTTNRFKFTLHSRSPLRRVVLRFCEAVYFAITKRTEYNQFGRFSLTLNALLQQQTTTFPF